MLIALDRAVSESCSAFADYLVALVVDYAVWESRPTGVIDRDKAHWLVTTLSAGDGPTATAQRIAFEIVREADRCDEALLGFALRKGAAKPRGFDAGRILSRAESTRRVAIGHVPDRLGGIRLFGPSCDLPAAKLLHQWTPAAASHKPRL